MSVRDVFEDLFGLPHQVEVPTVRYPETAQDGGHPVTPPNADAKYFDPAYPKLKPVADIPGVEHPDAHWLEATKQGKFIPYIGDEPHGMAIDVDPNALPVNDIDLIAARGHAYGTPVGAPHAVPVPVTIVDTPSFFGIEKKFATNQYVLAANSPILLCGRRPERNQVTINVTTSGPVSLAATVEQVNAGLGFLLGVGQQIMLETNQQIWALTTVAGSVISCVEEFTVVEGQKRF